MEQVNRAALRTFAGAFCIAFSPIFVKSLSVPPTTSAFFRCFIGGIALLLFSTKKFHLITTSNMLKSALFLFLPAFFFALDLFVWHKSILISGAGVATILANTQIFYLTLIGILFFKERPFPIFYWGFTCAIIGIALLVTPQWNFAGPHATGVGVVYGLLTGLFYTGYILSLRKGGQGRLPNSLFLGFVSLICATWLGLFGWIEGKFIMPEVQELPALIALGLVSQALGWWLITTSLKDVPVARAGLILLAQPALATLLGWWIYAEVLSLSQIIGAVLTLLGIYLGNRSK